MMRCFFNLVNDRGHAIRDREGVEVLDVEKARIEAKRAIEEMRREDPAALAHWSGWWLEVADCSCTILLSFALDDYNLDSFSTPAEGAPAGSPLSSVN